jgi:hypothetical protein
VRRGAGDLVIQLNDRYFVRRAEEGEILVVLDTYAEQMFGKVLSGDFYLTSCMS